MVKDKLTQNIRKELLTKAGKATGKLISGRMKKIVEEENKKSK